MLRIPTVSRIDPADTDDAAFEAFHDALGRLYPHVHERLEYERFSGHAVLYRLAGNTDRAPLVLMAHMDVVPVVAAEWEHDPFGATLIGSGDDAEIHARGAIDDKGALVAILEAMEGSICKRGRVTAAGSPRSARTFTGSYRSSLPPRSARRCTRITSASGWTCGCAVSASIGR